jgi:dephospho-CoA kinase
VKVIGLTGVIGCGKSTVAGMLAELGAAVIDADALAAEIREGDPVAQRAIRERFGTLDRAALAEIVFADPVALADLEAILHPLVREVVAARLAALDAAGQRVAALEAIKLVGTPLQARCDQVWVVRCTVDQALERVSSARGMAAEAVRARLAAQSPQDELLARADVVIDNRGSLDETRQRVAAALAALVAA